LRKQFVSLLPVVALFHDAPKILGGLDARRGVAGVGARSRNELVSLRQIADRWLGPDLMLTARAEAAVK
jgi:riboflavin biosynthesis pyrimidine reductase